jgi:hypothetical protein
MHRCGAFAAGILSAAQTPRSESGPVLLNFEQLSSEILITVEDTAEESDSSPTLATAM